MLDRDDYKSGRAHPVGRPPLLTSELIEEISDLVIQGKSIARAAVICGVSESSIYRWLKAGREQGAEAIYIELVERINEAVEFSEFEALQTLRIASQEAKNWRAAAWILERRFPSKYGNAAQRKAPGVTEKGLQEEYEPTA